MKTKVITSENDKIGVILYGCKIANNPLKLENIYILQRLDSPDASSIKLFESKIGNFSAEFGFAKDKKSQLFEALQICHQEFKAVEHQSYNKRIFLFTNEEDPGNEKEKAMAKQRASDLASLGVDIVLFPLPKPDQAPQFNVKTFYADIILYDDEEDMGELLKVEGTQNRIGELMKRIRQKEFKKRVQGKCLFSITPKS
mmetsp:Transcript_34757/g.25910  ORF Transcript_34757/g.25910 Transcript_34757/m.25910 type:complete len:199 (+) Transcript_34757:234-830(+)